MCTLQIFCILYSNPLQGSQSTVPPVSRLHTTTDRRIFYIQSPQPNPDWGISYILSQPHCLPPTVLVNNWFSLVSTHSSHTAPTPSIPVNNTTSSRQHASTHKSSSIQLRVILLRILLRTIRAYWSNLQFFSELITTQLRDFHMVPPQVVFTLIIYLTMQSYKFYLIKSNTRISNSLAGYYWRIWGGCKERMVLLLLPLLAVSCTSSMSCTEKPLELHVMVSHFLASQKGHPPSHHGQRGASLHWLLSKRKEWGSFRPAPSSAPHIHH